MNCVYGLTRRSSRLRVVWKGDLSEEKKRKRLYYSKVRSAVKSHKQDHGSGIKEGKVDGLCKSFRHATIIHIGKYLFQVQKRVIKSIWWIKMDLLDWRMSAQCRIAGGIKGSKKEEAYIWHVAIIDIWFSSYEYIKEIQIYCARHGNFFIAEKKYDGWFCWRGKKCNSQIIYV